jgi:hypothetical protein
MLPAKAVSTTLMKIVPEIPQKQMFFSESWQFSQVTCEFMSIVIL